MILTEEDAKTKRCQESYAARETSEDGGNIYRPTGGISFDRIAAGPYTCIGSACMAWRWMFPHSRDQQDKTLGYCGKAGPA